MYRGDSDIERILHELKSRDAIPFIIIFGEGHVFGKGRHILLVEFVLTYF